MPHIAPIKTYYSGHVREHVYIDNASLFVQVADDSARVLTGRVKFARLKDGTFSFENGKFHVKGKTRIAGHYKSGGVDTDVDFLWAALTV